MSEAHRINKVLFTPELRAELDSKINKDGGTIDWENVINKPQLADGSWKPPVPTPADLPLEGNSEGDIRLCLDDEKFVFTWDTRYSQWVLIGASSSNIDWEHVTNKPTTFPPSSHTHDWNEITDKPETFPSEVHKHVESDIIDLDKYTKSEVDSMLSDKANKTELHTHNNKDALDKLTQDDLDLIADHETRLASIEGGYTEGHSHSNLSALNKITYSGSKENVDLIKIEQNESALTGKADKTTLEAHASSATIHVNQTEKDKWNALEQNAVKRDGSTWFTGTQDFQLGLSVRGYGMQDSTTPHEDLLSITDTRHYFGFVSNKTGYPSPYGWVSGVKWTSSNYVYSWQEFTGHDGKVLRRKALSATQWRDWEEVGNVEVTKEDVGLGNVPNIGLASKASAETGASNGVIMTPLRTKEAIDFNLKRHIGTSPSATDLIWFNTN